MTRFGCVTCKYFQNPEILITFHAYADSKRIFTVSMHELSKLPVCMLVQLLSWTVDVCHQRCVCLSVMPACPDSLSQCFPGAGVLCLRPALLHGSHTELFFSFQTSSVFVKAEMRVLPFPQSESWAVRNRWNPVSSAALLFLLGLHSWCLCFRCSCLAARKQLLCVPAERKRGSMPTECGRTEPLPWPSQNPPPPPLSTTFSTHTNISTGAFCSLTIFPFLRYQQNYVILDVQRSEVMLFYARLISVV